MLIRCTIDGLLLPANPCPRTGLLIAVDGDEAFVMEAIEARYYELVEATPDEIVAVERAGYRLLRRAADFTLLDEDRSTPPGRWLGRQRC